MQFRLAKTVDAEEISALYRAQIGRPFCVWNEFYPGRVEIEGDLRTNGLYVLTEDGKILGAVSVVPENELDGLPDWRYTGAGVRELARVAVLPERQGQGLAQQMIRSVLERLCHGGCKAVRLCVAQKNQPAIRVYEKTGFAFVGEASLYGGEYLLCERRLNGD